MVTALAVAITIPTGFAALSLVRGEHFSIEAFFAIGAMSFVIGIIGGLVVGLPTLWLARKLHLDGDFRKLAVFGCIAGAVGGIALSVVFWQGNIEIVMAGMLIWAAMGAVAGLIAASVWFGRHLSQGGDLVND